MPVKRTMLKWGKGRLGHKEEEDGETWGYICVLGALEEPEVGWASLVWCTDCKQQGGHDTNPRPGLLKE